MASVQQPQALCFITGNKGKLSEVRTILGTSSLEITALTLDLPELQGPTAEYIVTEKAKTAFAAASAAIAQRQGQPQNGDAAVASASANPLVMIEDTSLSFACMGGHLPGPYIKWFLDGVGAEGLHKMAAAMSSDGDTSATASCIFTIAFARDDIRLFEGHCKGRIVPPRGAHGFGWDSVFEPLEQVDAVHPKTFAEMTAEEKNRISHRALALAKLKTFFDNRDMRDGSDTKRQREQ